MIYCVALACDNESQAQRCLRKTEILRMLPAESHWRVSQKLFFLRVPIFISLLMVSKNLPNVDDLPSLYLIVRYVFDSTRIDRNNLRILSMKVFAAQYVGPVAPSTTTTILVLPLSVSSGNLIEESAVCHNCRSRDAFSPLVARAY